MNDDIIVKNKHVKWWFCFSLNPFSSRMTTRWRLLYGLHNLCQTLAPGTWLRFHEIVTDSQVLLTRPLLDLIIISTTICFSCLSNVLHPRRNSCRTHRWRKQPVHESSWYVEFLFILRQLSGTTSTYEARKGTFLILSRIKHKLPMSYSAIISWVHLLSDTRMSGTRGHQSYFKQYDYDVYTASQRDASLISHPSRLELAGLNKNIPLTSQDTCVRLWMWGNSWLVCSTTLLDIYNARRDASVLIWDLYEHVVGRHLLGFDTWQLEGKLM